MTSRNVAVFIDAENLFKGYGKLEIPEVSMSEILDQLEAAASQEAGSGSIAMSRAYADWARIGLEDYRRDVERAGVETMQVFSVGKAEKNAADIVLVVDCLRAAADLEQLEVFIIVSGDGDFVPLVRRLHELDKYVIGATLADHPVNNVLEQEVDQYVALKVVRVPPPAALKAVFSADPAAPPKKLPAKKAAEAPAKKATKQPAAKQPSAAPPAKKQPAAKQPSGAPPAKKANKQPAKKQAVKKQPAKKQPAAPQAARATGKPNWHDLAKDIPVVHAARASSPADYKAIIKQVLLDSKVRSFFDQLANHGGTLPILAMAIKAAAPKLSPSDARVSTLSRALR
ncbi:MAG: hypothetical protein JWQ70_1681, partial [Aeromicrobium sp.]|nr:hypothetical protein [Aeromicrobium sp.]